MEKDKISQVLNNNGAFFAFSDKQFNEQKKDNIKYVSMGAGLICPKENADKLDKELTQATKEIRQAEKEAREARAKALKIDKLPRAERINNRKILIKEATSRINNYMDSEALVDYCQELDEAKEQELVEIINRLINAIEWRVNDRPEVADIYNENKKIIQELKVELLEIIKE
jgi:hypothetical protein